MISDLMLGRLVMVGFVIDDYYGDVREYQESDKTAADKAELGYETVKTGVALFAIAYPILKTQMLGAGVRVTGSWVLARAGAIISIAAPITAGYMIGAVAGTAISQAVFGDEGAQTAMGFYSGGLLPGTEAPTLATYGNLLRPSETDVAGPVEIYQDVKETISALLSPVWTRVRPRRSRSRLWWLRA